MNEIDELWQKIHETGGDGITELEWDKVIEVQRKRIAEHGAGVKSKEDRPKIPVIDILKAMAPKPPNDGLSTFERMLKRRGKEND